MRDDWMTSRLRGCEHLAADLFTRETGAPGTCASNPIVVDEEPGTRANPIVVDEEPGACASNPIVVADSGAAGVPAAERKPTTLKERKEVVRQRKQEDPCYSDSDPESDGYSCSEDSDSE